MRQGLQGKAHASETYKQLVSSLEFAVIPSHSYKASGTATPILSKSFDKQLHKLSTHQNMRISKSAPDLLKKAVTSVKSKTDALRTKLIILASVRRRLAIVQAMSRQIHELVADSREKSARVQHRSKPLMMPKAVTRIQEPAADHGVRSRAYPGLFEVDMFEENFHAYPDWTNSLFEDDNSYRNEEDDHDDDHDDLDILDALEEPSVIEIIRSKREVEGLEFNMDDDTDEACDLFIRRFRSRMSRSLSDLCISE